MDKALIPWIVAPLLITIVLLGLVSNSVGAEYCSYLPVRCALVFLGSSVGGMLIFTPFVAAISGTWYLFSKKRHRLPLVIAWCFLILALFVLTVSGQISL